MKTNITHFITESTDCYTAIKEWLNNFEEVEIIHISQLILQDGRISTTIIFK